MTCNKHFLTFGFGPHGCVGREYAINHLVAFLALVSTSAGALSQLLQLRTVFQYPGARLSGQLLSCYQRPCVVSCSEFGAAGHDPCYGRLYISVPLARRRFFLGLPSVGRALLTNLVSSMCRVPQRAVSREPCLTILVLCACRLDAASDAQVRRLDLPSHRLSGRLLHHHAAARRQCRLRLRRHILDTQGSLPGSLRHVCGGSPEHVNPDLLSGGTFRSF